MHGTQQEIFTCTAKPGSSERRRGPGCGVCPCASAYNSSAAPRGEERVRRKRKEQGGSFARGSLERGVPHRSTGSGIAAPSVNPGAAQRSSANSSGSSEPQLPNVGNGRMEKTKPGEVQELSAVIIHTLEIGRASCRERV